MTAPLADGSAYEAAWEPNELTEVLIARWEQDVFTVIPDPIQLPETGVERPIPGFPGGEVA